MLRKIGFMPSTNLRVSVTAQLVCSTGGGGSSIVKVPGDVPPARVCFFKPSNLAKGILFANFSPFSLAKGILFANFHPFSLGKGYFLPILVKEMSNFGNSCKETQIFSNFGP